MLFPLLLSALLFVFTGCPGEYTDDGEIPELTDAGAAVSFITYEAEDGIFQGRLLGRNTTYREFQSEASGRKAVALENNGDYAAFTLTQSANAMVIRYSMPDSPSGGGLDGSLAVYAGDTKLMDIPLTSRYMWVYAYAGQDKWPGTKNPADGYPCRFFDDSRVLLGGTYPEGTEIIIKKEDDTAYYIIDMAEFETVPAPLSRPSNSLSIADYGAAADGRDCRAALNSCIGAAKSQGRQVWIPEGTFFISGGGNINVSGITVGGAGIWYSTLSGGAYFMAGGDGNYFHDFAIFGDVTVRVDENRHCAVETGSGGGNRFENLWLEHVKCGFWVRDGNNTTIKNCRIRNTFADGINLTGFTKNSTVENCDLRNSGDDAIAINSENQLWTRECTGNTVKNNTIRLPYHANGIAVYGGGGNTVQNNAVYDTVAYGGGINISSRFNPAPFRGTTAVRGNVLIRTGSVAATSDWGRNQGAIWLAAWDKDISGVMIRDNLLIDSVCDGIVIDGRGGNNLSDIAFQNISVEKAAGFGIRIYSGARGSGTFTGVSVTEASGGGFTNGSGNFVIDKSGGNSGW